MPAKKTAPWLDTLIDVQKVFTISDDKTQVLLGGQPLSDNQLAQLQSEAMTMDRMQIWPLLIETVRQQAIATGFNRSENFEALTSAKGVLYVTDWIKSWTTAIKSVKIKAVESSSRKT
jgi:hypothetical protein